MIGNDRTVLVLGAGASHPYGLPLGAELTAEPIEYLPPRPTKWSVLSEAHAVSDVPPPARNPERIVAVTARGLG